MLEKLLEEIRKGGTLQPAALAARLGASVGLVEMMLEDLERRGLVKQMAGCGSTCQGCSLADSCSPAGPSGRLWMWNPSKTPD